MSDLAQLMAPHVQDLRHRADDTDSAVELHQRALEASGAFSAMRLQRERRAEQRQADAFHAGRAISDWQDRLTTSPGAARAAYKRDLVDMARQALRLRDACAPGSKARAGFEGELHKLSALVAAA